MKGKEKLLIYKEAVGLDVVGGFGDEAGRRSMGIEGVDDVIGAGKAGPLPNW